MFPRMKLVLLLVYMVSTVSAEFAFGQGARGGTHGGGGSGVACTQSRKFDMDALAELYALEFWEKGGHWGYWQEFNPGARGFVRPDKNGSAYFQVLSEETPQDFLTRILVSKYGSIAPHFVKILIDAVNEVSSQTANCGANFEVIQDFGLIKNKLPEDVPFMSCARVQLARRVHIPSKDGSDPYGDFRIEFNCDLFNRFGSWYATKPIRTINQALLLLHEALYLILAKQYLYNDWDGGLLHSAGVREITNTLMTPGSHQRSARDFRRMLQANSFDDYFLIVEPKESRKLSRRKSYIKLEKVFSFEANELMEIRRPSDSARDLSFAADQYGGSWYAEATSKFRTDLRNKFISEVLVPFSNEEAFLYAAVLAAETLDIDFDSLFIPGVNEKKIIDIICKPREFLKQQERHPELINTLVPKVESYCQGL